MKILKTLVKISAFLTGILAIAGEVIFYLMSHRKGSVDFLWSGEEPEKNRKIRLKRESDLEWLKSQDMENYYITSEDGLKLHASLLKADKPSDKYVLAIHGYRCYGLKEFDSISRFYHEQGVNVFMIDHRASGQSEGTYITYGAKESRDCILWLGFMIKTFGQDIKILLHGCSMGSATTMLLLGMNLPDNVKFAVTDCGYASLKSQLYHNFCQYKMPAGLCYFLYKFFAKIHGDFDADSITPVLSLESCKIPVIFVHGMEDGFVPFNMVYAVYDACPNENKKLIKVQEAEHVQSFQYSQEYKDSIIEYIKKFM